MDSIISFDIASRIIFLFLLIIATIYVVCETSILTRKTFNSTAIVTKKEYVEPSSTTCFIPIAKTLIPYATHFDAEYNVYFNYEGTIYCIDNEHLYNKVCVNDAIPVIVDKGFNKCGEVEYVKVKVDQTFIN